MQQIISPAILGMFQTVAVPQSQLRCCAVGAVRAICELMGGTPAASCRDVRTAPAVVCMLFIPRVEFSATFRHVWSSQSWCFAQSNMGLWVCVQWVPKRPQMRAVRVQASLYHYINIQSCHFMQQFISPAILGMVQTVAVPQSQLRCCAVGAVQPFAKPNQIFRNSCSRCGACISAALCILVCLSPQRVRWCHWRGAQLLTESRAAA